VSAVEGLRDYHYPKVYKALLSEVDKHEMTVLHDDGLYRHLRFAAPGTGMWSFNIITWPGHLATSGDIADGFMFSRTADMTNFFEIGQDGGEINASYWAEKMPHHIKRKSFSSDLFDKIITEYGGHTLDDLRKEQPPAVPVEDLQALQEHFANGAIPTRNPEPEPEEEPELREIDRSIRTLTKPYVISIDEYPEDVDEGMDKVTVTWYTGGEDGGILAQENGSVIDDVDYAVGEDSLQQFGVGSQDPNIVYVRNHQTGCDYEIVRSKRSYNEAVHGVPEISHEPPMRSMRVGDGSDSPFDLCTLFRTVKDGHHLIVSLNITLLELVRKPFGNEILFLNFRVSESKTSVQWGEVVFQGTDVGPELDPAVCVKGAHPLSMNFDRRGLNLVLSNILVDQPLYFVLIRDPHSKTFIPDCIEVLSSDHKIVRSLHLEVGIDIYVALFRARSFRYVVEIQDVLPPDLLVNAVLEQICRHLIPDLNFSLILFCMA